ncbi:hypothetical protein HYH02_001644 [Chlamydomonas schloesseri]|uniref:DAGKc domain-containing protein n=1 Tax=Chlamydomonas schloesseri TaxID=2026947 RepID=A0A835WVE9_9CHLO|nr:hypothetical protein HYH02_001644 [Chlamydomonas schloesseri]|eukprot:KAG2453421.1 hypothetical protein HYH02_001644 [Chlamydomonas schloesseri]
MADVASLLPLEVKTHSGHAGSITLTPAGDVLYSPHPSVGGRGFFSWLSSLVRPNKKQLIPAEHLIGAKLETPCRFTVWWAQPYTSRTGCVTKHRFKACHSARFETPDTVAAQALVELLRRRASWWGRASPPHVAAIVNPVSGKGGSRRLMEAQVLPLLRDVAGLRVTVHVTQARMHAAELVRGLSLSCSSSSAEAGGAGSGPGASPPVDLIMFVGGDGTLYEGLQGLFQRPDWESAVQCPMAAVPCGSGNGLAASAGLWDPVTAVVSVCRGRTEPVDVASVLQPPGNRFYCLLSVVYGSMANLDIGTQHLRWMGELRFHLGGLWEIIRGRLYNCRIFVLPPGGSSGDGAAAGAAGAASPQDVVITVPAQRAAEGTGAAAGGAGGAAGAAEGGAAVGNGGGGGMHERLLPARQSAGNAGDGSGSHVSDYPAGPPLPVLSSLPALPRPLPDSLEALPAGWQQLPDSFAILGAYNTQYLALGARANPGGRMGDGAWDVWHMADERGAHGGRRASGSVRSRALKVLLGIEDGGFAKSPGVMRTTKARALMFEQRDSATWTVLDGEEVPNLPLYLEVHQGICRLLVAPQFAEEA